MKEIGVRKKRVEDNRSGVDDVVDVENCKEEKESRAVRTPHIEISHKERQKDG